MDSNHVDLGGTGVYWWERADFLTWAWNAKQWDPEARGNYFAVLVSRRGQGKGRRLSSAVNELLDREVFVERGADLLALVACSPGDRAVDVEALLARLGPGAVDACAYWNPDSDTDALTTVVADLRALARVRYGKPVKLDETAFATSLTALLARIDHL